MRVTSPPHTRFVVVSWHSESGSVFHVTDSLADERKQPAVLVSFSVHEFGARAQELATDLCAAMNSACTKAEAK